MNRCNRNMKTENKKREQQTKQDIPKVTDHEIIDENYHLSQRRDDTDMSTVLTVSMPLVMPIPTHKIDFLKAVNSVKYLERKKIEELETGKSYLIEQVERITTKYGDAIIAILQGPLNPTQDDHVTSQSTPQFKVFLPKRFITRLSDDHLKYMNEGGIYLKFNGGRYNDLEFH